VDGVKFVDGLELAEISLVASPANVDARFEILNLHTRDAALDWKTWIATSQPFKAGGPGEK
jgi:hypothetical protein